MAYQCEPLGVNTETSPQFSLVGTSPMHFLRWGGFEMRITLTDEQHLMLELIADKPLPAIPEIARYTGVLAAARLIELTAESQWTLTSRGEAMLEPRGYWMN
jgi:hypothetical protein